MIPVPLQLPPAIVFPDMGKEKGESLPSSIRLDADISDRVKAYKKRHPLRPTLSQVVDAALRAWLPQAEAELPPSDTPSKPRPK